MTFIWLIVWLIAGTPQLVSWNAWLVALVVCVVLDLTGGLTRARL